jgi:hypothetical protein
MEKEGRNKGNKEITTTNEQERKKGPQTTTISVGPL